MIDTNNGVMIALLPIVSDWARVDYPHLTLVYAGKVEDLNPGEFNEMAKDASSLASISRPITLKVMGLEHFGGGDNDPQVDALRVRPTEELMAMRRFVENWNASDWPFNPHITTGDLGTFVGEVPMYIGFDRIAVNWGDECLTFSMRS